MLAGSTDYLDPGLVVMETVLMLIPPIEECKKKREKREKKGSVSVPSFVQHARTHHIHFPLLKLTEHTSRTR